MAEEQGQQALQDAQEVYPRYRWVIIGLSILFMEASGITIFSLGMLLPAMRRDLGFSPLQAGWLGSINAFVPTLLAILMSVWLVRFSPKRVLSLAMGLCGGFAMLQGLAPTYWLLLAGRGFYALAGTAVQPSLALLRLQWVPKNEMATVIGLQSGLANVSQSIGFMLTPFLLLFFGTWRLILALYGLLIMGVALLWTGLGRERITPAYQQAMASTGPRAPAWTALRHKEVWMCGACLFGNIIPWIAVLTFWPTYLVQERGFSLATAGFAISLLPMGGIVASFTSGFISDRIGLRRPVIWPAGLVSPFVYLGMLSPLPPQVLAGLSFLVGYLAYAPVPAVMSIPYELPGMRPAEVPVGLAAMQTVMALASTVGPLLAGTVTQLSGSLHTGLLVCSLLPVSLVIVGLLMPETGPKARRAPAA